jgi:hypothetical protein
LLTKKDSNPSPVPYFYRFTILSPIKDTLSQYCRPGGPCALTP